MKQILTLMLVLASACLLRADDCEGRIAKTGDCGITMLCGRFFSPFVKVRLAPADADPSDASHAIRCFIVYEDGQLDRPVGAYERGIVKERGRLLNEWLCVFLTERLAGLTREQLAVRYRSGEVADLLNGYSKGAFRDFVAGRLQTLEGKASGFRATISFVGVEACGALADDVAALDGGASGE